MAGAGRNWPDRLEEWGVRSLAWLVFVAAALLFLLGLSRVVPGAEHALPAIEMTVGDLSAAIVSIALVLLLISVATRVRLIIRREWSERTEIAIPVAGIAHWTIIYGAVIIAYEGLHGAVYSLTVETPLLWIYDAGFFMLGVIILLLIAYQMVRVLDPLAQLCSNRFSSRSTDDSGMVQSTLPLESSSEEGRQLKKRW